MLAFSWVLAASLVARLSSASAADGPGPRPPNFVILLADDLRADALGALGNPVVQSPHLDRLIARGRVFDHAYCLGSNSPAVCLPSRNMLLSGRAYFRWSEGPHPRRHASADEPNLPTALAALGYDTFHCGKRGNVAEEIEPRFATSSYLDDARERTSGQPGREVVDRALAWLAARRGDRPFLLYLAFETPHDPRVAAPDYLDRYTVDGIPLPANFLPQHPFDNGELAVRDELLAPHPRSPEEIRRHLRDYYGVITGWDHHVGRLLDGLKAAGHDENTVYVLSSDNGLALGSHGLMGKQSLYDHSMRVPLVMAGPGIEPGRSSALVYLLDLFPTLCELAGGEIPPGLDGRSLVPVIRGQAAGVRETLFLSYRQVQRAVRDERYKLITYPQVGRSQLFDLTADPDEMQDLAQDPTQRSRMAGLREQLVAWQRQLGDTLELGP